MREAAGSGCLGPLGPGQPIVAIGAHFDDIELGCGGVIASARRKGCPVTMVVLTASNYTHATDGHKRSAELASSEGRAAAAVLGVDDVRCLDLPNTQVRWDGDSVAAIEEVLSEVQPSLILTHWAFDSHQDHHHGAMATFSAARYMPSVLMYDPIFPSGRSHYPFRAQVYCDITEVIDAKIESLRQHASQFRKYGQEWIDAVAARARWRGYESQVGYAEAFEVVRLKIDL